MSVKVVPFTGETRQDIDAAKVLDGAKEAGLVSAVVIGRDADGYLYFASSVGDGGAILWDIEQAKHVLLTGEDD